MSEYKRVYKDTEFQYYCILRRDNGWYYFRYKDVRVALGTKIFNEAMRNYIVLRDEHRRIKVSPQEHLAVMKLKDALDFFFDYCQKERNAKEQTISGYRTRLQEFYDWWGNQRVKEFTNPEFMRYKQYLIRKSGYSKGTAGKIDAVKRLFRVLHWAGAVEQIPNVEMKDFRAKEKKAFTSEQIHDILKVSGKHFPVMALMAGTGMGVAEAATIDWHGNIDWENRWIRYTRVKTGRPVEVPMSDQLFEMLRPHRKFGKVFESTSKNRAASLTKMSADIIKRRAGLQDYSSHCFRVTYINRVRDLTDKDTAALSVGHSDAKTTETYLRDQLLLKKLEPLRGMKI